MFCHHRACYSMDLDTITLRKSLQPLALTIPCHIWTQHIFDTIAPGIFLTLFLLAIPVTIAPTFPLRPLTQALPSHHYPQKSLVTHNHSSHWDITAPRNSLLQFICNSMSQWPLAIFCHNCPHKFINTISLATSLLSSLVISTLSSFIVTIALKNFAHSWPRQLLAPIVIDKSWSTQNHWCLSSHTTCNNIFTFNPSFSGRLLSSKYNDSHCP